MGESVKEIKVGQICETKAKELQAKEPVTIWQLSEREKMIVEQLGE